MSDENEQLLSKKHQDVTPDIQSQQDSIPNIKNITEMQYNTPPSTIEKIDDLDAHLDVDVDARSSQKRPIKDLNSSGKGS